MAVISVVEFFDRNWNITMGYILNEQFEKLNQALSRFHLLIQ